MNVLTDAFIFPAPNLVKVVRRVFQDLELVEHDVCLERVGENGRTVTFCRA
jgi:hypothetical protein